MDQDENSRRNNLIAVMQLMMDFVPSKKLLFIFEQFHKDDFIANLMLDEMMKRCNQNKNILLLANKSNEGEKSEPVCSCPEPEAKRLKDKGAKTRYCLRCKGIICSNRKKNL